MERPSVGDPRSCGADGLPVTPPGTPLRALHVVSGKLYGGVESALLALARCRDACDQIEQEFALCFDGRLKAELTSSGVPVHSLGEVRARYPLSVIRARRRLRALIADRNIDAVCCHLPWAQAIFAPTVRAAGIIQVFWMHGAADGRHWLERWAALCTPDLAICNSRFTAATLPHIYSAIRPEVIHEPAPSPDRPVSSTARAQIRLEIATPADDCVIVQVSRMEQWKGQPLLLDALALLKGRPGWTCWLVGGPQQASEARFFAQLREQAQNRGVADRVRFLGQRSDVPRLLSAADVFCQPNLAPEPFGVVFVEALYAGLPVVATAMGGALEIVDETCGILTAPGDARAVATALRALIEDPGLRARLGSAGPERARVLCDPAVQVRRLAALIEGICRTDRSDRQAATQG
jgi:glycosyltransferase involved in cell wall biosynthesis